MARNLDAKCRQCRREGVKLFLKGERCFSLKCPIERKGAVPPGQHGYRSGRRRPSEYGRQLREKQKVKRFYGVLERQFKNYFKEAAKVKREAGERLLQLLELRLDNVVFRLGLAPSRSVARQLVTHGHVMVDNRRVDIASYRVKPNQLVTLGTKALKMDLVKQSLKNKDQKTPKWLVRKAAVGKIERLPKREEIETNVDENLIVAFYSR